MVKFSLSESQSNYYSLYMGIAVGTNRKLKPNEKPIQQCLYNEIINLWPNSRLNEKKAKDYNYSRTGACVF